MLVGDDDARVSITRRRRCAKWTWQTVAETRPWTRAAGHWVWEVPRSRGRCWIRKAGLGLDRVGDETARAVGLKCAIRPRLLRGMTLRRYISFRCSCYISLWLATWPRALRLLAEPAKRTAYGTSTVQSTLYYLPRRDSHYSQLLTRRSRIDVTLEHAARLHIDTLWRTFPSFIALVPLMVKESAFAVLQRESAG
jgi:hypothetical protein